MNLKKFFEISRKKMSILNEISNQKAIQTKRKPSVCLIGVGPHAKRIYLNYLKKHHIDLKLVVELESKEKETKEYLNAIGFKNSLIFSISDSYKDKERLPKQIANNLTCFCKALNITHMIVSTEPKAHNMYLHFAFSNNIHVLTDKPITVTKNMYRSSNIKKVNKQYYKLLEQSEKTAANCVVMCQRQYHKGYEYIKNLLEETVREYQIPITYIEIYHCDGNWEMPHDLEKENHPYKYGYGKLFHSGYHFIDLLSDLIKINDSLPSSKLITKAEVYADCFTPNDELAVCNLQDYKRIFKKQKLPLYYQENNQINFKHYGEKNFYGLLKFQNKKGQTITNVNLNLLHYGFSRRSWIETRDFYKSNGRIRHEYANIQVGTLMNIKIHSYQSKEIKDRGDIETEELTGGLEHFDIEIYRNANLIGGKPFERIKLGDLYSEEEKKNFLGYNELSREKLLTQFLKNKIQKGNLKSHILGIEILTSCSKQVRKSSKKKHKTNKINMKLRKKYIDLEYLKTFSNLKNSLEKKQLVNEFSIHNGKYEYGSVLNYLKQKNCYQIYNYIIDSTNIASSLNCKIFHRKFTAWIYFYYLKIVLKQMNILKVPRTFINYKK